MSIKASTNKRAHKRTNREKFDLQNHNKRASSCEMKGRKDEEETNGAGKLIHDRSAHIQTMSGHSGGHSESSIII